MQPWLRTALTLLYNDISMKMNSPETDFPRCLKSRTISHCWLLKALASAQQSPWLLEALSHSLAHPLSWRLTVCTPLGIETSPPAWPDELCETGREAPPTGCEGLCWRLGDLTEAEKDHRKLRFVRTTEEERDVKPAFFFFIMPTLFF